MKTITAKSRTNGRLDLTRGSRRSIPLKKLSRSLERLADVPSQGKHVQFDGHDMFRDNYLAAALLTAVAMILPVALRSPWPIGPQRRVA
jgi:hypothetical protein